MVTTINKNQGEYTPEAWMAKYYASDASIFKVAGKQKHNKHMVFAGTRMHKDLAAAKHSLRKWDGLDTKTLDKYGLYLDDAFNLCVCETDEIIISIASSSCALCQLVQRAHGSGVGSLCEECPIVTTLSYGGFNCSTLFDEAQNGDIAPMVKVLRDTVAALEKIHTCRCAIGQHNVDEHSMRTEHLLCSAWAPDGEHQCSMKAGEPHEEHIACTKAEHGIVKWENTVLPDNNGKVTFKNFSYKDKARVVAAYDDPYLQVEIYGTPKNGGWIRSIRASLIADYQPYRICKADTLLPDNERRVPYRDMNEADQAEIRDLMGHIVNRVQRLSVMPPRVWGAIPDTCAIPDSSDTYCVRPQENVLPDNERRVPYMRMNSKDKDIIREMWGRNPARVQYYSARDSGWSSQVPAAIPCTGIPVMDAYRIIPQGNVLPENKGGLIKYGAMNTLERLQLAAIWTAHPERVYLWHHDHWESCAELYSRRDQDVPLMESDAYCIREEVLPDNKEGRPFIDMLPEEQRILKAGYDDPSFIVEVKGSVKGKESGWLRSVGAGAIVGYQAYRLTSCPPQLTLDNALKIPYSEFSKRDKEIVRRALGNSQLKVQMIPSMSGALGEWQASIVGEIIGVTIATNCPYRVIERSVLPDNEDDVAYKDMSDADKALLEQAADNPDVTVMYTSKTDRRCAASSSLGIKAKDCFYSIVKNVYEPWQEKADGLGKYVRHKRTPENCQHKWHQIVGYRFHIPTDVAYSVDGKGWTSNHELLADYLCCDNPDVPESVGPTQRCGTLV